MTEAIWEGKGLFGLHIVTVTLLREAKSGTQTSNLEAEADTEIMEDAAYRLASHGLFTLFSYRTQDHQSGVIAPTMGRAQNH